MITQQKLDEFTNLLYTKENEHFSFRRSLFNDWELLHSDTDRCNRNNMYRYIGKYLKDTAVFSMWECTHSKVEFNSNASKQLNKAIEQLKSKVNPYT